MAKNAQKKTASKKQAARKSAAKKDTADQNQTPGSKKDTRGRTAAVLIAGVVIMVAVLVLNVGSLAKMAVEKIASDTLGVDVSIVSLDVSLQDRQIDVSGITIENPQGYQNPNAFTVDSVQIAADEISKETLVFDKIRITGTNINLEVRENKTNLMDIHGRMDSAASKKTPAAEKPVKVIIRELVIENAKLTPAATLAGEPMEPVVLPDIRILGIGERTNGMLASEAMSLITDRVVTVAMRSSVQSGYLQGMNDETLKQIQKALDLPSGFMDQVRDLGDKVIKDLFGN